MKRLSLFGEAQSCAELSQMATKCHKSNIIHVSCGIGGEHKGCCNNKSFDFNLDFDAGEVLPKPLTDQQIQFVDAYILSNFEGLRPSPTLHKYSNYNPPPLGRDIPVLFQIFRL